MSGVKPIVSERRVFTITTTKMSCDKQLKNIYPKDDISIRIILQEILQSTNTTIATSTKHYRNNKRSSKNTQINGGLTEKQAEF